MNQGRLLNSVNSLMPTGINVCVFEAMPCSRGLIFVVSSGLVNNLGTHQLCLRVFIFAIKKRWLRILPNKSLTNANELTVCWRSNICVCEGASLHVINLNTDTFILAQSTFVRRFIVPTQTYISPTIEIFCLNHYILPLAG